VVGGTGGAGEAYVGTAGEMLDFSPAAGLEPMRSSFSRRDFSWEMILRVAIVGFGFWVWMAAIVRRAC
jgi:hypothetical protein